MAQASQARRARPPTHRVTADPVTLTSSTGRQGGAPAGSTPSRAATTSGVIPGRMSSEHSSIQRACGAGVWLGVRLANHTEGAPV